MRQKVRVQLSLLTLVHVEYCMDIIIKICSVHGETEHKAEKQNKAGVVRYRCLVCSYERQKRAIRKKKQKLVEAFGGKCAACGYNKYIGALEFHHRDRTLKEFKVSSSTKGWKQSYAEAKKCVLLCSNCHKEIEGGVRECPPSDDRSW